MPKSPYFSFCFSINSEKGTPYTLTPGMKLGYECPFTVTSKDVLLFGICMDTLGTTSMDVLLFGSWGADVIFGESEGPLSGTGGGVLSVDVLGEDGLLASGLGGGTGLIFIGGEGGVFDVLL
jgi:hypothetical protein